MKRRLFSQLESWRLAPRRKPFLLKGARQVGKTYLLRQFGRERFAKFHYLNFEEDKNLHAPFKEQLTPENVHAELKLLGIDINLSEDLVIFDEIQACPQALTSLKYFAEQAEQAYICAAGSLLGIYMDQGSFPVGKVESHVALPMTFDEFLDEINPEVSLALQDVIHQGRATTPTLHLMALDCFKQYLFSGGMPEALEVYQSMKTDNDSSVYDRVRALQKNLITNYQADIAKHCGRTNAMHIERLWSNVPIQLANTQDAHAAKFKFKEAVPRIRGFDRLVGPLDWLMKAQLVLKTPIINRTEHPIQAFAKDNVFKLFMFDVGILSAFNGLSANLIQKFDFGTFKGYLAENFVAQELHALNFPLLSWQEGTAQIEFVLADDERVVPIEVKSGINLKAKSLISYKKRYTPPLALKLSLLPFTGRVENSTLNVPIYATYLLKMILERF